MKFQALVTFSVASVQGPLGRADWHSSWRAATTVQRRWHNACSNKPRGQLSGEPGTLSSVEKKKKK